MGEVVRPARWAALDRDVMDAKRRHSSDRYERHYAAYHRRRPTLDELLDPRGSIR